MKTEITFERLPSMMYLREAFIAPVLITDYLQRFKAEKETAKQGCPRTCHKSREAVN